MLDPNNLKDMAQLGMAIYEQIPDEEKKKLVGPSAQAIGRGAGSIWDIIFYKPNELAMKWNHNLSVNRIKNNHNLNVQRIKYEQMEQKISENIDYLEENNRYTEEKIGTAFKALEESKYSLNSDILRECFTELITNSVDKETVDKISPNFATILGNLTEEEAFFLKKIKDNNLNPIPTVEIYYQTRKGTIQRAEHAITIWPDQTIESSGFCVSSLVSMGLIFYDEFAELASQTNRELYTLLRESEINKFHKEKVKTQSFIDNNFSTSLKYNRGSISVTDLGELFIKLSIA